MSHSIKHIPVHRNPHYHPHGLKSYVYALNKYGITPTQPGRYTRGSNKLLMKTLADGTQHAVTANDQMTDSFYTCPVQVGTPPQTVNLDFDSGSSDLWMWSNKLDRKTLQAGTKNNIKVFDSTKSTTFKAQSGYTWSITYGDSSGASGTVGLDNVTIGDITIEGQAIELASKVSSSFQNESSSGLLGLAFGNINTVKPQQVKTPVDNMIAQQDIPKSAELWTVYLGSVKDVTDPDKGQSFYTFGAIDQTVVAASKQQIAYTPIDNSQGFWMFDSESATVNGKTVSLAGNKAIADTGTTLMLCSDAFCEAVYSQIPGAKQDQTQGGWVIPAGNISARPDVTVAVGNAQITIEKEQLGWSDLGDGSGMVFGAIQSRGSMTFDIFGDTFLICVYAIFDVGNTRFGVVQRPDPTPAGSSK